MTAPLTPRSLVWSKTKFLNLSDEKSSHEYLALAKALVPDVHDEADIDSVRALALLVRRPSSPLLPFKIPS
jgi:hypothetical protein